MHIQTSFVKPTIVIAERLLVDELQAIAYFVQWLVVGIVISLIYAPATVP